MEPSSGAAPDPNPGAAPDADPGADPNPPACKPSPWKPSGALSNPDPTIEDMSLEEYNQSTKGAFFQPCAKVPKRDGGHQCSLFEREPPDGSFHQASVQLPILSVSGGMFICKCRCVCVVDCGCMINNVVLVPLPG